MKYFDGMGNDVTLEVLKWKEEYDSQMAKIPETVCEETEEKAPEDYPAELPKTVGNEHIIIAEVQPKEKTDKSKTRKR